jgi:hypothetical protein
MRWLWAIMLFLVLTAAGGTVVSQSSAIVRVAMIHHTGENLLSAATTDHCHSPLRGKEETSHKECCQGINCAPASAIALIPFTIPMLPRNISHNAITADRIVGRSVEPETGPPRPLT